MGNAGKRRGAEADYTGIRGVFKGISWWVPSKTHSDTVWSSSLLHICDERRRPRRDAPRGGSMTERKNSLAPPCPGGALRRGGHRMFLHGSCSPVMPDPVISQVRLSDTCPKTAKKPDPLLLRKYETKGNNGNRPANDKAGPSAPAPATIDKVPEHVPASHRVQVRVTPERVIDHRTVQHFPDPDPPREFVGKFCRRFEHHLRIMELVAPEPCGTHRAPGRARPLHVS